MERKERKSGVEKLKDALYSRTSGPQADPSMRTPLSRNREHTPHAWEDIHAHAEQAETAPEPAMEVLEPQDRTIAANVAKKFSPVNRASSPTYREPPRPDLMPAALAPKKRKNHLPLYFLGLALIFFITALGVAAFLFLQGGNTISSQNIDLAVVAPSLTDSGKPAVIQYIITNRNQESLQLVSLVITYPSGTRSAENMTQDLPQERLTVGDVPSGAQVIKTSSAVFFGIEGSPQNIAVTLEYHLPGSDAVFTKESDTNFIIGSSPVSISVTAPDEAISGQAFNFDVTVGSNATVPLKNVALEAENPFGFSLTSADPKPTVGNSLWRLGDLMPGENKTIHLTGILTGSDGDNRVFHFKAGSESDLTETSLGVPLLTSPLTMIVRKPFISTVISVGGASGATVAVPLGDEAQGSVAWQNNLPEDVAHAVFTLSLSGEPLDSNSVVTNGFYDSSKSQIVWSEQTDSTLSNLAPGSNGTLQFSFKTQLLAGNPVANPHVDLALTVAAVRAAQGKVPENVTSAASMKVDLASAVTLSATALHFTGNIKNSGPMPPLHNEATTYTILWTLKNSSNDIAGGAVTATLPPYMEFVAAPDASDIAYDADKRQVTWTLGNVAIGAGYSAAPRTADFQVKLTPSVTQVGQLPTLTSDAVFTGTDRYAGVAVTTSAVAPSTRLTDDTGFVQGMEMVK